MAKGKKIAHDEEVPFDSLSDKGQYQAFQRAYGKENQAMLALIVLTVVWSYAAHVYGHATVFHCFTRSIMLVLCCFMLFHLLKQGHAMCERALAPGFTTARVTAAAPEFKPYSKPAAHKEKKKADKKDKPKRIKKISKAHDEPAAEPATAAAPTPAGAPALTPEPAVVKHKKRKEPAALKNKKSLSAAQSAVEHAKAEALMASRALQESTMKHKKAEAAAHQAAQQARVTIRQTIKAPPVQLPSPGHLWRMQPGHRMLARLPRICQNQEQSCSAALLRSRPTVLSHRLLQPQLRHQVECLGHRMSHHTCERATRGRPLCHQGQNTRRLAPILAHDVILKSVRAWTATLRAPTKSVRAWTAILHAPTKNARVWTAILHAPTSALIISSKSPTKEAIVRQMISCKSPCICVWTQRIENAE